MSPQAADPRAFKDDVFGHIARIGAALGHAKRIEILDVLLQGESTVDSPSQQVAASVANTSRHLQILAAAGLVTRRAEGTSRVYRVADGQVASVYLAVRGLARSNIADVSILAEAFFAEVDGVRAVTFEEFDELHRTGEALLVDVRPAAEFAAGHAEGAVNIPLADLDRRLAELPTDRTIVAYCRGPYCVFAADAVTRLREAGLRAVRLEEGYPEWRESGRPVSP